MEIWDVLDANGEKTGKSIERGKRLEDGLFHLVVHIYIINKKGEFLIQRRAKTKANFPGVWEVTAGSVIAGETSLEAALRETREELGIELDETNMRLLQRIKRGHNFYDIWVAYQDIDGNAIVMQEEEVEAVRWVTKEQLISILSDRTSSRLARNKEHLKIIKSINLK